MSQAPVRRKSRRALAAAAVQKPAPHLVILRVKRKRGDDPVDSLLVSTDEGKNIHEKGMPDRKRRAPDETGSIEETLADLSLEKIACVEQQQQQQQEHLQRQQQPNEVQQRAPKRLCYKRVRTTGTDDSSDRKKEKRPSTAAAAPLAVGGGAKGGGGGRLDALLSGSGRGVGALGALSLPPRPAAALDFMEVRRVKARAIGHVQSNKGEAGGSAGLGGCEHRTATPSAGVASGTGAADFHVIDLQAVGRRDNDDMDTSGMGGGGARGAVKGGAAAEGRAGAPILSPGERQMDAAIFKVSCFAGGWFTFATCTEYEQHLELPRPARLSCRVCYYACHQALHYVPRPLLRRGVLKFRHERRDCRLPPSATGPHMYCSLVLCANLPLPCSKRNRTHGPGVSNRRPVKRSRPPCNLLSSDPGRRELSPPAGRCFNRPHGGRLPR